MFTVVTLLASVGAHRKPAKYAKIGISYEMRRDVGMKKTTRDNGLVAIVPHVPLGDSYRIQTYNLLIRSQMLYSVELRSRYFRFASAKVGICSIRAKPFPCFFKKTS